MPQLIDDTLYVSSKELLDTEIISQSYLKKALYDQRSGKVNCWQYKRFEYLDGKWIEHSSDTRKGTIYLVYDSLKPTYKKAVEKLLCDNVEPYTWAKNKEAKRREESKKQFKESITDELDIKLEYVEFFQKQGFKTSEVQQYARAAAWLDMYNNLNKQQAKKLGFEYMQELRETILSIIQSEIADGYIRFRGRKLNSLQVLYRHARNFKKQGCQSLISAKRGNQNKRKINDEQHAWLMNEVAKPTKPSFEDIAMKYNAEVAPKHGWPELTTSAIRQYLNKPVNKRVWYFSRHGRDAGNEEFQSLMKRKKVSFPDALVSLDGTALQLYYQDASGKMKSELYIYFIVDVYSLAIVGYSVAFAETAEMVTEALRNYIQTHGYKPYQLQYDNSSANVSAAVKGLMKNMSKVAFPCKPYRGRSKYVETIIGHFEQRVLRHFENFKGGSPTTRTLNSKANPDLLKQIKNNLPTEEQVINQLKQAVEEWNSRGEYRNQYGLFEGETRLQRYAHTHEKRQKLNYFDKLSLFMVELDRQYKYGKQGVKIRVNGTDRNYIVPDPDQVGDFMFQNTHYGEEFTVKINLSKPDMIELWKNDKKVAEAIEKEHYAACMADMQKGEHAKIKKYQMKQEQYGMQQSITELERQRAILESVGATGTDGVGWQDMPKAAFNKKESEEVDEINQVSDESDLVKRLKQLGQ